MTASNQPYDADYFLNGVSKGVSNYTDYRWLQEPTMNLAQRLIEAMGISGGDSLIDIGCARGYLVKALRRCRVNAFGYDISDWAIENCDPDVKGYVTTAAPRGESQWDHVVSKDVQEHLDPSELHESLARISRLAVKSAMVIVPLAGGNSFYVRAEDNFDKTHRIIWPLEKWMDAMWDAMDQNKWTLQGSWHIPGLKPTSLSHPKSCGFITLRRV